MGKKKKIDYSLQIIYFLLQKGIISSAGLRGIIKALTVGTDFSGDMQRCSLWHIYGAQNIVFENITVF